MLRLATAGRESGHMTVFGRSVSPRGVAETAWTGISRDRPTSEA